MAPFTRRRLQVSLTWQFSLTAFVIVAFMAAILVRHLQDTILSDALDNARNDARDVAMPRIAGALSPADLAGPLEGDRLAEFDRNVRASVISGRIPALVVWNAAGDVVYSTYPQEADRFLPDRGAPREALSGATVLTLAASAPSPGQDDSRPMVQVAAPLRLPGVDGVAGAVTVARIDTTVVSRLGEAQRLVLIISIGGLAVLYLALMAVMRRTDREISRQQTELERATVISESAPDLVAALTPTGAIVWLNSAGRKLLGLSPDQRLTGIEIADFFPDTARDLVAKQALPITLGKGEWIGETTLRGQDGRTAPVVVVLRGHRNGRGQTEFISLSIRDVTERKDYEARLVHLARHDPLTGLVNRRRFEEELGREVAQAKRYGTRGAIIYINVDRFSEVNDRFGFRSGDMLLARLAGSLKKRLRETDLVARLAGDEFILLLPQTDAAQARITVNRLTDMIRRDSIAIEQDSVRLTVSAGVAVYPEHGTGVEELMVRAGRAMHHAKVAGGDGFHLYQPEKDGESLSAPDRTWEGRIKDALHLNKLVLYVQPIMHLGSGEITQYEVLLRMHGEDGEVIAPNAFLPTAERSGLIHDIDRWVVRQSVQLIAEHQRLGHDLYLEVNLSGSAFADHELLPLIQYELLRTRINPACLTLEITETAAIQDMDQAHTFISTLRGWGCRFAIDDFGVGFGSFSYLKHLPVDYVKLDGSFIRNLPRERADQHLVRAMVEVTRVLGKQTVAEFVADQETLALVRSLGVDFAQGYHVGKPHPIDQLRPAETVPVVAA